MPQTNVKRHKRKKARGGSTSVKAHKRTVRAPTPRSPVQKKTTWPKSIHITLEDGVLEEVEGLPPGWDYEFRDVDYSEDEYNKHPVFQTPRER